MAVLPVTENKPQVNIYESRWKDLTWVYIEKPSEGEARYLAQKFPCFHPLNLEDILSKIQLPKIDEYDDHLFIVLHFPVFNQEARVATPSEVDTFIGNGFLVTVHCSADLKPLAKLFKECQLSEEARQEYLRRGSGYLLYRIQEVMRVLTIVMATMMPLTVITGIYGMNVHLPLGNVKEGGWHAFIVLLVVMTLITGGMLFFFRRRRWI